ncbi:MAG: hypothetical protein HOG03_08030 [Desulfobacula sp.]|jgi:hypothetical protein|uniref:hypothetical protein n=1 Tax=Desulfobacula sp. TaxID=2593537 RepID=UPI001DA8EEED|nr:hypothetical protein [Desulfobacula sp.]MBT3485655.1 hypothetical protein [Desulfobacula sp.]MBT3804536.1 hypothetical protein [Desulfobacula sp.]MBT4025805.1 hypothetical protein [Desulfobacula sp.]MBT4199219.1 hypothetical protein [Desulfobacula sp.]
MTEKIQPSGLCINCINADECSYRMNHTKPVIFCEEFSCTDLSKSKTITNKPIDLVDSPIISFPKEICSNCEDLEICCLQKKDSNVIRCEQYK